MPAPWTFALLLASGVEGLSFAGRGTGEPPVTGNPKKASTAAGKLMAQDFEQSVANPSGCPAVASSGTRDLQALGGIWPIEQLKEVVSYYDGFHRSGGVGKCHDQLVKSRWCHRSEQQEPYFGPNSGLFQSLEPYLTGALRGTDTSRALTVAIFDVHPQTLKALAQNSSVDSRAVQALNFLCGWERLGILDNHSAIFVSTEELQNLVQQFNPRARVLYSPLFKDAVSLISNRTGLGYVNRVWKLMVTQLMLNLGRDLLLTDIDVYFVRDPVPKLHEVSQREGLEFAAMADFCWLEVNSGFLYYRNTKNTKRMLEIALTTRKDNDGIGNCTDNDQYLLNCAFGHAAVNGLHYRVLPQSNFVFNPSPMMGAQGCHSEPRPYENEPPKANWLADGLPYIWHTSGFSANYDVRIDNFEALGAIDVDPSTRRCLGGMRGSKADATEFARRCKMSCYTGEGGLLHAACTGTCAPPLKRWERLKRGFGIK